jgi:hypothetical protein
MSNSNPLKHQDISTPKKKVLFSSKSQSMHYFDLEGIKQRTSYSNIEDLYIAVVKEQFDNQIDWLHDNYKGSIDEKVTAVITISKDKINYRFRNTNPDNIEIEAFRPEILKEIFNFDKTKGSKQNRHVFGQRGLFGDASKFIGGIAPAILHSASGNSVNAFYNTQWKEPICYRSNGIERQVFIEVNRAAAMANVNIIEPDKPVPFTDTEVEITLPIISSLYHHHTNTNLTEKIFQYCQWYKLCTRDITFDIQVIDNTVNPRNVKKIEKKATPFRDGIIKAVEKLAKKVHTFRSIGIRFLIDTEIATKERHTRGKKTSIKDVVRMMLQPRIDKIEAGETWDDEQTQDSLWYNALPLFEEYNVKYSNDSRAHFKNCIRQLCKEHGIAREEIGIIAAPWGSMFFKGQWFDISFDTIQDLSGRGTDIVFIEKRDIVRALGRYASDVGVALVNTHGLLSDYTEDLAELADKVGANIALLSDYDIPGLLICSKLSENVPRLGVDERMLREFGITHENKRLVIPYTARKARLKSENLKELVENDKRFNPEDVDINFLRHEKIEIDAILSDVGAQRLWQYLQDLLNKEFPTRNYNRVIDPAPDLSKHYPPIVEQLKLYYDKVAAEITKEESKKIEEELEDVEGFIDVQAKEKEILDDRLGKIVREDEHLTEVAEALVKLIEEKGYKITELEIPTATTIKEAEAEAPEEKGEVVPNFEGSEAAKYQDIIPDPPITKYDQEMHRTLCESHILDGREKDCFQQPIIIAKERIVDKYGSKELNDKLAKFWDSHCRWQFGYNEFKKMLEEAYEQVIRQYKEQHNNSLPWENERGGGGVLKNDRKHCSQTPGFRRSKSPQTW